MGGLGDQEDPPEWKEMAAKNSGVTELREKAGGRSKFLLKGRKPWQQKWTSKVDPQP